MNLLSINLARSIWLGPTIDFNPRGIRIDHSLFPYLIETYKFKKYPLPTETPDMTKGILFEDGAFTIEQENYPVGITFTIFNDGLVADTRSSTIHSDAFLENVLIQASEIFKISNFQTILREKVYISQVFVSTDKSIELLNPKLNQISKYLSKKLGKDNIFQLGGLHFWHDQKDKNPKAPFTFERTVNVPFSENRYYSAAPLQTEDHLELLDKLESILS